ncbi:sugar lactone lactonase YvrE [Tahibacter aquaticus]|uniref:Sugar lactone lactonase YvrE n=1 Tax=Tahibacter aquaticus TaxID=520092 RepID=A0A4R6YSK4_9GAMM|nr:hypothetical protein [Tahibacter aquaticus]TDR41235.1 sugar lactone lactonase YvrE [Tahibacter aquaticus]
MHHPIRVPCRLLAAAALGLLATAAVAQTLPQWSRPLAENELSRGTDLSRRNWAVTADGGSVVINDGLRRFEADGRLRYLNTLSSAQGLPPIRGAYGMVAPDNATDAVYVALGAGADLPAAGCTLLRIDLQGRIEWNYTTPGGGACLELAVAADGSLIVRQQLALARIARNGTSLWSRKNALSAAPAWASALLLDAQQNIVLGHYADGLSRVSRYSLGGSPIADTAMPDPSLPTLLTGLDLLPNGDIAITATTDPAGNASQTGALYLLSPSHSLRLLHVSPVDSPYMRSVHDDAGSIYVQAGWIQPTSAETVRAIDPVSGQQRWERDAKELAARSDGVLVVARSGSGSGPLTVSALSSAASSLWTTTLPVDPNSPAMGGALLGGRSHLRVSPLFDSEDCGTGPVLFVLDDTGTVQAQHKSCTREMQRDLTALSAQSGFGVLANSGRQLRRFDSNGALRWEFFHCRYCNTDSPSIWNTALLPDGGAWLIDSTAQQSATTYRLLRLHSDGSELARFDLPYPANGTQLFVHNDRVRLIDGNASALRWQEATAAQGVVKTRDFALSAGFASGGGRQALQALDNGDIVLTVVRRPSCSGWVCTPEQATVLRIDSDGNEAWRFETTASRITAYAYGDGRTLLFDNQSAQQPSLRLVDAQGNAAAWQVLSFPLQGLIGPSQGRFLATGVGGGHYLIDGEGNVSSVATPFAGAGLLAAGHYGFLVSARAQGADAALLDPVQLATLAIFDVDGIANSSVDYYAEKWRMSDDGSIHAQTGSAVAENTATVGVRTRLSQFAVPGTPAAQDRLFIDRFD